jgi:hypothetical protein
MTTLTTTTLRDAAAAILEACGNDITQARLRVDEFIDSPIVNGSQRALLCEALRSVLADVWVSVGRREHVPADDNDGWTESPLDEPLAKAWRKAFAERLWHYPISPSRGLELHACTGADLDEWTARKRKRLRTEQAQLAFIESVRTRVETGQRVEQALTSAALVPLAREAGLPEDAPLGEE